MQRQFYMHDSRQGSFSQTNNNNMNNNNNSNYGFVNRVHQQQQQYTDQIDNPMQMYNNGQLDDMTQALHQTSTQRVTAAMYPETMGGDIDIPSTQFTGQQTAVQRMAEPSQILKNAVVNLINYQDDADLATRALPELLKLLDDQDHVVVNQAAMVVHQLSKKEACRHALSSSTQLVQALIQTMERSNDVDTLRVTSEILHNLSQNNQGLLAIFKTGGIRALIQSLSSPVEVVVFNALSTLHNLLLHQEGSKMNVRLNGGLQKLVTLLQRDNVKFLTLVADCLHILAYGNQEGKLIILASGGPAELVRILHSYDYEKLLLTAARVIKVLSVCPSNKPALIQAGATQTLAIRLSHPNKRIVQECLWTLRNLSDGATKEQNVETLLQMLIQLLNSTDVNIVTCTVGTLSNLTCNNQINKNFVCKFNGIQAFIQTIRNAGYREEITEPATCALRHLTNRHPDAIHAQDAVRINGGLVDVAKLLDPPSKWPLLTATAGLIRNLACNKQNITPLRELGVLQKLCLLLGKSYQAYQESPDGLENLAGIKMDRVMESILSALHALASDYQIRALINSMNIMTTLITLLYNEHENIVIVTLDLLSELAQDPQLAPSIGSQGVMQVSTNLLSSPSEPIQQRAALLFSLISGDKSPEYTQRLSNEINTLFQSENNDGGQWLGHHNDIPSVYAMEDHNGIIQGPPSVSHSIGSRQNIYSSYVPHDIEVPDYIRSGQVLQPEQIDESQRQQQQQQNSQQQQPHEPWYDTDL